MSVPNIRMAKPIIIAPNVLTVWMPGHEMPVIEIRIGGIVRICGLYTVCI